MSENAFFYYDPEDEGFQPVSTLVQAEKSAEKAIRGYLDDSWDLEVEGVCMGIILKKAKCTYERSKPEDSKLDSEGYDSEGNWWGRQDSGDGVSEFDEICDYTLEQVMDYPEALLTCIPLSDLVRELERREGVKVMNNCIIGDDVDDHNAVYGKILVVREAQ